MASKGSVAIVTGASRGIGDATRSPPPRRARHVPPSRRSGTGGRFQTLVVLGHRGEWRRAGASERIL